MPFVKSAPPSGYVPGLGRGASGFTTRSDVGPAASAAAASAASKTEGGGSRAAESRAARLAQQNNELGDEPLPQYDAEDEAADEVWASIDERMRQRKKKAKTQNNNEEDTNNNNNNTTRKRLATEFAPLKNELSTVSEDQWAAIPEVGDYSLKHKRKKAKESQGDVPITDALLKDSMEGLGQARGTVLGMELDKKQKADPKNVDKSGYLTSLVETSSSLTSNLDIADLSKARLLLKSVRDTNPNHGPGWIAAARVEEAAGKILKAKETMQQACQHCPQDLSVWLETCRLHSTTPRVQQSILAQAVQHLPHAVELYIEASKLENTVERQRAVLRKGLETNPNSVRLWKEAMNLETDKQAVKLLLAVAVEECPQEVDFWLALARLEESNKKAQAILNRARQALPAEVRIWMAAAQWQEANTEDANLVQKIVQKAVHSLDKQNVAISRDEWLAQARQSEESPLTCAAIVQATIHRGVDQEDLLDTIMEDAKVCVQDEILVTARAILQYGLTKFPSKPHLWMKLVDLEKTHGDYQSLDTVLERACKVLPKVQVFWLLRAKQQWLSGKDVSKARDTLSQAFNHNPSSQDVWLAAVKLEWETQSIERARVLCQRAMQQAPSPRVFLKAAMLEREQGDFPKTLELIQQGLSKYPKFVKLFLMGGQVYQEGSNGNGSSQVNQARRLYQQGLQACPNSTILWRAAAALEESQDQVAKARSLLEMARRKNPQSDDLWLAAVRLEERSNQTKLAESLLSKGLQECPSSGKLWSKAIRMAPRPLQKSKATHAIQACPEDALVITTVACLLFAKQQGKIAKARKWLERAVTLDSDLGDTWAHWYAMEVSQGTKVKSEDGTEEKVTDEIIRRCVAADPKHGELWTTTLKQVPHWHTPTEKGIVIVAERILKEDENDNEYAPLL